MTAAREEWTDAALLTLMRANAPRGVRPEDMLPVMRGLVASGADPRAVVAAVGSAVGAGAAPSAAPSAAASTDAAGLATSAPSAPAVSPGADEQPASYEPLDARPPWRRRLRRVAIVVLWLLVWEIADRVVDNRLVLTGPVRTAQALVEQASDAGFWLICAASFGRIALGFVAAFCVGILLAGAAHRSTPFRELLSPLMSVLKTVPMVSFIIMLLIWVGGQVLTIWLAFLIVVPLVYTSMAAGLSAVDTRTLEMARVFRLSALKRFLYVYRPVFMPFLVSTCQVGLGMSWKAGIMAEVFATPAVSIGKEMFTAKTFLDTPSLFAWTAVVMVLSLVFERFVMMLLRRLSRPFGSLIGRA